MKRFYYWILAKIGFTISECIVEGCNRKTIKPEKTDPRKRWVVNYPWKDENDQEIKVTFCPLHIKEFWQLDEVDYLQLSNTETFTRDLRVQ